MAEGAHHPDDMWVFPHAPEVTAFVTPRTNSTPDPTMANDIAPGMEKVF